MHFGSGFDSAQTEYMTTRSLVKQVIQCMEEREDEIAKREKLDIWSC